MIGSEPGRYPASVITPDRAHTAAEPFRWSTGEADNQLLQQLASGFGVDTAAMEESGTRFFEALFIRRITRAYAAVQAAALSADQRLGLRLVVWPSELAVLPCELLFDPDDRAYLSLCRVINSPNHVASMEQIL